MAARGAKPKKPGGKSSPKPAPSKRKAAKGRTVLGNDPFERGAAVRPVAVLAPLPGAASEVAPVEAAAVAPEPVPDSGPPLPPPGPPVAPVATLASPSAPGAPPASSGTPAPPSAVEEVRSRLVAVEARVESFASSAAARLVDLAHQEATGELLGDLLRTVKALLPGLRERLAALAGLGSLLLSSGEVDAFGCDEDLAEGVGPIVDFLYSSWWRVEARAIERVPESGPAIVVANHGGVLPWDALVLRTALRRDHPARRDLRPLLDENALARRVSGPLARRLGAVAATPENATQLLEHGGAIAVFPEGSRGSTRPWADRYRIQRFGRGGFVRLALRLGAPIVPCAIVGSEETALPMARAGWLSSALGMPFLTSPPPMPFVPLGGIPLPARWSLRFGAPIETASAGPEAAGDGARVLAITEHVRASLQQMLDEDVAARRSVYL